MRIRHQDNKNKPSPFILENHEIIAGFTEKTSLLHQELYQAEKLAHQFGLVVADMPMIIQAMMKYPKFRNGVLFHNDTIAGEIDTLTSEYIGWRSCSKKCGDPSLYYLDRSDLHPSFHCCYEVWHSVGSLASSIGQEQAFHKTGRHHDITISQNEWCEVGSAQYKHKTIARIHLDDLKKGDVPAAGTPYTIFVRLDWDKHTIHPSGKLNYDKFMLDDRMLMIAGSPDNREALARLLFGGKIIPNVKLLYVGSNHNIIRVNPDSAFDDYSNKITSPIQGNLVHLCLLVEHEGISAMHRLGNIGRYALVAPF